MPPVAPPPRSVARRFGGVVPPVALSGGQARTFRAGPIVLKPAGDPAEVAWLGETLATLDFPAGVRVPRPVRANGGAWIEQGWIIWQYLDGSPGDGRYAEKLAAARPFHAATKALPHPGFLAVCSDAYARADRIAWQERPPPPDPDFAALMAPLLRQYQPVAPDDQLIHGDLSGNFILSDTATPGIIDIAPYWRPAAFAEAVMLVDTVWAKTAQDPTPFRTIATRRQMTLRALVRRIAEQAEHAADGTHPRDAALATAKNHADAAPRLLDGLEADRLSPDRAAAGYHSVPESGSSVPDTLAIQPRCSAEMVSSTWRTISSHGAPDSGRFAMIQSW